MKQLEAGELPLNKIFSTGDYDFVIPDYQRPYAWGVEQALQLLDDLESSLDRDQDEPYFLGSIVLVKDKGEPRSEVIDGQQRLTTTTILMAVIRDLVTDDDELARQMQTFVEQSGNKLMGTKAKPRLTLRSRDAAFFRDNVQAAGNIAGLCALTDNALKTDAQKAIRDNAKAMRETLASWDSAKRQKLFVMLAARTFLVVVSTPDLASAHRIFSVMNARGLDLTPSDIFKSQVIGDIDADDQGAYADKWEDAEEDLGRDRFAELFLHIRMVYAKVRAQRELLKEFPEQVLNQFVPGNGAGFVDDVLIPYAEAYEHLVNQDFGPGPQWEAVNAWLKRLVQIDNNDWRPAALWALRHHHDDPVFLAAFLRSLERLAASMLLRRSYTTPRTLRYADLLKQLDNGDGLGAAAFELDAQEQQESLGKLGADIYLVNPVRKYVLLRLNELLANVPGVSYDHKIITVEHVLPQTPKPDSEWMKDFTDEERQRWTHKLGNLLLLNRTKNSQAQNFDFDEKKTKYFTGSTGVTTFALTTQVLNEPSWTPAVIERRHRELLSLLAAEWSLDGIHTAVPLESVSVDDISDGPAPSAGEAGRVPSKTESTPATGKGEHILAVTRLLEPRLAAVGMTRRWAVGVNHGAVSFHLMPGAPLPASDTARVVANETSTNVGFFLESASTGDGNWALAEALRLRYEPLAAAFGLTVSSWHGSGPEIKRDRVLTTLPYGFEANEPERLTAEVAGIFESWSRLFDAHPYPDLEADAARLLARKSAHE